MLSLDPDRATEQTPRAAPRRRGSPRRDRGALSGVATGVSFLTGFGAAMLLAKDPFPRPGATAEQLRTYFRGSASAARFSATGQLISAVSLARFTASIAALARRSGPRARRRVRPAHRRARRRRTPHR